MALAAGSELDRWWRDWCATAQLSRDLSPVLVRRVRAVGRGELPGVGAVFVKAMAFPRAKDRLRYAFRALPAAHEARMLAYAAASGVLVPEVVGTRASRRAGLPWRCMLVTRALPVAEGEAPAAEIAERVAELFAAGIAHPDLHSGNFVRCRDDRAAVLDLQSARKRRPGLSPAWRLQMLGKLLEDRPDLAEVLRERSLASETELDAARQVADRLRAAAPLRRIERCLRDSTDFAVRRRLGGTLFERRGAREPGRWVPGGVELFDWWVGDRALEVLDGRRPSLGALYRKSWWRPGRFSVYIPDRICDAVLPQEARALREGFARIRHLRERQ